MNVSIDVSSAACSGACNTIIIDPTIHIKHPIFPVKDRVSLRKMDDNIALIIVIYEKPAINILFYNNLFYPFLFNIIV